MTARTLFRYMVITLFLSFSLNATAQMNQKPVPGNGGLSGSPNVISGRSGIDDKSVMSVPLEAYASLRTFLNAFRDANTLEEQVKAATAIKRQLILLRFLEGLLYTGAQIQMGRNAPIYTLELLFSNTRSGLDFAASSYIGTSPGYAIALRKDLIKLRQDYADDAYRLFENLDSGNSILKSERNIDLFINGKISKEQLQTEFNNFLLLNTSISSLSGYCPPQHSTGKDQHDPIDEFNHLQEVWRISAVAGMREENHFPRLWNVGLSASRLVFLPSPNKINYSRQGIYFYANLGVSWLTHVDRQNAQSPSAHNFIQSGAALFWQDKIPYILGDKAERWQWQSGIEYRPRNALDQHDVVTPFVRYRNIHSEFEATISYDWRIQGDSYIRFSIGKNNLFVKHRKDEDSDNTRH